MSELSDIEEILDPEARKTLEEAKSSSRSLTIEEKNHIRSINTAIDYTVESLANEDQYFDPVKAASLWEGEEMEDMPEIINEEIRDALDKDLKDIIRGEENDEIGMERIYESFRPRITPGGPLEDLLFYSEEGDYEHPSKVGQVEEWHSSLTDLYKEADSLVSEFTSTVKDAVPGRTIQSIADTAESPAESLRNNVDIDALIEKHNLELPAEPESFGKELLRFFIEDYRNVIESKENESARNTGEKQGDCEERPRQTYTDTETRLDRDEIPEIYSAEERKFVEEGARYLMDGNELEPGELRKLIWQAREATEEIEVDKDTSLDGSSRELSKMYQSLKRMNEKNGGIENELGKDYTTRKRLNELIAGMEFVSENATYEEEVEKAYH